MIGEPSTLASAAVCAERRSPDEGGGYILYWAYPFSPRIHSWILDERGVRVGSNELTGAERMAFLSRHKREHAQYLVRLLALAIAEANDLAIAALLPEVHSGSICHSIELAFLCCSHPSIFSSELVTASRRAIEIFLSEVSFLHVVNPISTSNRLAPLRRFADGGGSLAGRPEQRAGLDLVLGLGELTSSPGRNSLVLTFLVLRSARMFDFPGPPAMRVSCARSGLRASYSSWTCAKAPLRG